MNAVVACIVTARDFTKKVTAEPDTIELANVVKNTMTNNKTKFRDAKTSESVPCSAALVIDPKLKTTDNTSRNTIKLFANTAQRDFRRGASKSPD
jgi:hypothetical protein